MVSLMTDSCVLLQKFGFLMKLLSAVFHQKTDNRQRDMEDNYSDIGIMSHNAVCCTISMTSVEIEPVLISVSAVCNMQVYKQNNQELYRV